MKELFVTYEAAKKLADFGFKEDCLGVYFNKVDDVSFIPVKYIEPDYVQMYQSKQKGICAPLKTQAIFWLMEGIGEKDKLYDLININICSDLSGSFDNIDISEFGDATMELYEFVDLNDAIDYLISLYKNL